MQHSIALEQIEIRAKAINIGLSRMAELAGVNPSTVFRCLRYGSDPRSSTRDKLNDALDQEERRILDHLARLHPLAVVQLSTVTLCEERRPAKAAA